jgi:hypothetical protein
VAFPRDNISHVAAQRRLGRTISLVNASLTTGKAVDKQVCFHSQQRVEKAIKGWLDPQQAICYHCGI